MKKKVLFCIYSGALDGIGRALLGYISTLDLSNTEIHIGLFKPEGVLLSLFPSGTEFHVFSHLDTSLPSPSKQSIRDAFQKKNWIKALTLIRLLLACKIDHCSRPYYRYMFRKVSVPDIVFDEAQAFHGPWEIIDYWVCDRIKAQAKIGWIHVDVSRMPIDKQLIDRLFGNYQSINVVSRASLAIFNAMFPQFKGKTQLRLYPVDKKSIRNLASFGNTFEDSFSGTRILTVGRIAPEKGQREAIETLAKLIQNGENVAWYFVGDGEDLKYCMALADRLGVAKNVSFLGFHENPYRYMQDCGLYVQPSRHEGYCISLAEACCFEKPIVSTNFSGAKEQLEELPNTRIVDVNTASLLSGILDLLPEHNE